MDQGKDKAMSERVQPDSGGKRQQPDMPEGDQKKGYAGREKAQQSSDKQPMSSGGSMGGRGPASQPGTAGASPTRGDRTK